jgi:hypothetical protein
MRRVNKRSSSTQFITLMLLATSSLVGLQGCTILDWNGEQRDRAVTEAFAANKAEKAVWGYRRDLEGESLAKAWQDLTPSQSCLPQVIKVPKLLDLQGKFRDSLLRHFATSAKWRVYEVANNVVVTRRSVFNGNWTRNNIFSELHYLPATGRASAGIEIYPGQVIKPGWGPQNEVAWQAEKASLATSFKDRNNSSITYFQAGQGVIAIQEHTPFCERNFTRDAIASVAQELEAVGKSKTVAQRGFDPKLMPEGSIRLGQPEIKLRRKGLPGIYYIEAYLNPGEAGYVYVKLINERNRKVIEPEQTRLDSLEYTGWSTHSQEQFFYSALIQVYAEKWSTQFPGRFELWFHATDKEKPDKLLMSKTDRIHGANN